MTKFGVCFFRIAPRCFQKSRLFKNPPLCSWSATKARLCPTPPICCKPFTDVLVLYNSWYAKLLSFCCEAKLSFLIPAADNCAFLLMAFVCWVSLVGECNWLCLGEVAFLIWRTFADAASNSYVITWSVDAKLFYEMSRGLEDTESILAITLLRGITFDAPSLSGVMDTFFWCMR